MPKTRISDILKKQTAQTSRRDNPDFLAQATLSYRNFEE